MRVARRSERASERPETHVHVAQQVVEAAVAVVGGAAERLEDAQPLGAQRAAVRRQLGAQDPDVVHPLGVAVVHAHVHQHVAHEAVAVGRAVVEDLAHHRVVEVVRRGVGDGLHHEQGVPQHVGVGRVDVAVDGVFHLGAELAG